MATFTPLNGFIDTAVSLYSMVQGYYDDKKAANYADFSTEATRNAADRAVVAANEAAADATKKAAQDQVKAKALMSQLLPVVAIVGAAAIAGIVFGGRKK